MISEHISSCAIHFVLSVSELCKHSAATKPPFEHVLENKLTVGDVQMNRLFRLQKYLASYRATCKALRCILEHARDKHTPRANKSWDDECLQDMCIVLLFPVIYVRKQARCSCFVVAAILLRGG